jgi:hypothetical protein
MVRCVSQLAMLAVAACTFAPHSVAFLPSPLRALSGRGRAGCAVSRFRAGLEDRPADVQRVRDASAGFLGDMLGAAAAEARRQRSRRVADAPTGREKMRVGILAEMDSIAWDVARGLCRCGEQVVGGPVAQEGEAPLWQLAQDFPGLVCSRPPPLFVAIHSSSTWGGFSFMKLKIPGDSL